ncbi:hypothetical protein Sp245p_28895 (plasmid) [Azospirillum baldaniorum]|uniref:Structural phage protein n=1 Tax=Azospirillum baldaniorum TaxID=1064539 RepID=A0A9P1NQL2_9PROT|nr:DnaT-like ssDNA-binding protein [Azospirillum baldaniorum]AWJ93840.1 hypothetical protein Sp245p_28895 [Azospirillum baldaniorum]TWA81664.1 hypothetical protein FBZ85_10238 [Azospirillum brasilense]CCD02000.1 putative Structural phage protein [Azospirillum baldaniorum]
MALIVEDGTGVAAANSYISQADLDAFWSQRGNPSFGTMAADSVELLVIQAMDLFHALYGSWLRGRRVKVDQALEFPRADLYDNEGLLRPKTMVPPEVKKALCLLVQKAIDGETIPDSDASATAVKKQRQKVGDLEIETEYTGSGVKAVGKTFNEIEMILAPVLGSKAMGRVVRG